MASEDNTDQYEARRQKTRRKLIEGLERLRKRTPNHPKLQQDGYRLNVSTLELESGVSRNAMYTNHQYILEDLEKLQRRSKTMPETLKTPSDKIAELRELLRVTIAEKRLLATENASLLVRIQRAEKRLAETKRKLDKLQAKFSNERFE